MSSLTTCCSSGAPSTHPCHHGCSHGLTSDLNSILFCWHLFQSMLGWLYFFLKSLCPHYHQVNTFKVFKLNRVTYITFCLRCDILYELSGTESNSTSSIEWDDDQSWEECDLVCLELVLSAPVLSPCCHGRLEHPHISPMPSLPSSNIFDPACANNILTSSSHAALDQEKTNQYQTWSYLQGNLWTENLKAY